MFYLLYVSSATRPLSQDDLKSILEVSQKNNAKYGITGILLYKEGHFMQVLEGGEMLVKLVYAKIANDGRHENVVTLLEDETETRQFPNWTMGFFDLNDPQFAALPGYSEYMNIPLTGEELSRDMTKCERFLALFKQETALVVA